MADIDNAWHGFVLADFRSDSSVGVFFHVFSLQQVLRAEKYLFHVCPTAESDYFFDTC